jgi:NadR type nicotinamide-nucleotide adenylyltransferase
LAAIGTRVGLTVCLTGPECTGKTTLAARLASHFGAPWVPEFAREYALRVGRPLTFDDVEPIAKGEMALLDAPATDNRQPTTSSLTILDTDLISTVVYSKHYYGQCPEWIEREARARQADLYLLAGIDVPWTDDDVRDTAAARAALHGRFATTLAAYGANVLTIGGDWEERFATAVAAIDDGYAAAR